MFRAVQYDEFQILSAIDCGALHDSKSLLAIFFDPADAEFIEHVGSMATVWLGSEKIKALDAGRLVENKEWLVPVLSTEFLPKVLLLNTRQFTTVELTEKLSKISVVDFFASPAVHLDYQ